MSRQEREYVTIKTSNWERLARTTSLIDMTQKTFHSILPLTVQVLLKEHYKAILLPPRSKR